VTKYPASPASAEDRDAYEHSTDVFTVASKGVERFRYDSLTERLFVTYITGKTYCYRDVPEEFWEQLKQAASKGRSVNFRVKPYFDGFGPL